MIHQFKFLIFILTFILPLTGHTRLLHIIHTNDLHSYFKGYHDGKGGYARLKTKIQELRDESEQQGVEVLQLDAGDWGEGTSFFMSDEGAASVKALELLGVDVAVIGNHDHMMGGNILGQQIRRADVDTQFVSANIVQTPQMNLGDLIPPYVDMEKADISIRVVGLSTSSIHFQYQIFPGRILSPIRVGRVQARRAKDAGKELVIALTHIGQSQDVALARISPNIDLIVGGHSHDRLEKVRWVRNWRRGWTPIVQAGSHGLVVGSLLLDVKDNGAVEVVNYKLHEIKAPLPEESNMANFVMKAAEDRNQYFGGRWDEIIGETLVPLTGYVNGRPVLRESCWGRHMAKMSREVVHADVGVHLSAFEGVYIPPGPVTFGAMVDNYPHFRKYGDPGWEISTVRVTGSVLRPLMRGIYSLRNRLGVNFSGLSYKADGDKLLSFEIEGKSVDDKAMYTLAFPSEVGLALKISLPRTTSRLLPSLRNSGKFFWPSMEHYIRENSPIRCQ
jgi:2',3'-cyclic-nucleotide 2'-phosphodiesterase (5'-nucleotidase family)